MRTYEIKLYQGGLLIETLHPETRKEAWRLYHINAASYEQYTQLVVDGKALTTAQAGKFFGGKKNSEKALFLGVGE